MTAAAQVVTAQAPSAPPSRGKDDASVRQPGKNNGFEKALDSADVASSEPVPPRALETVPALSQSQEAGSQSSSARGRSRGSETEAVDDTATEPSADIALSDQLNVTQVPGFALALAALSVPGLQQDPSVTQAGQAQTESAQPVSDEAMLSAILSGSGATSKPQAPQVPRGPQLPSETDPLTETLSLLGISEEDVADVQASADQTVAKVVGQQTHLAMSRAAPMAVEAHSAQLQVAAEQAAPSAKTPARADAAGATQSGDAPVSVPALTEEQVPTAAVTSNEGESSTSGQERRQPDGGQAQQTSSATQTGLSAGPQTAGASSVDTAVGTASSAMFESYTDSLSPGGQIARSVKAEIAATDRAGSNGDGVLKVLHIELKPQNLGSVTVRMSLKDDVISLHMETSRPETAAAIEKERSALTSALKAAGYVVDEITTQPMDVSRAVGGHVEAAANDASMSSSFAQGDGRSQAQQEFSSFGRRQGGQRGASGDVSLTPSNSAGDGAGEISRSRTGAIYV